MTELKKHHKKALATCLSESRLALDEFRTALINNTHSGPEKVPGIEVDIAIIENRILYIESELARL